MKSFLRRKDDQPDQKKTLENPDLEPVVSAGQSTSSQDLFGEVHPMFIMSSDPTHPTQPSQSSSSSSSRKPTPSSLVNDPNLNINPVISNLSTSKSTTALTFTQDSHVFNRSVFSKSGKTMSTRLTSYFLNKSSNDKVASSSLANQHHHPTSRYFEDPEGQALQVIEDESELLFVNNNRPIEEIIADKIRILVEDVQFIMGQYSSSAINLTSAVINCIDCFKAFTAFTKQPNHPSNSSWNFDCYNNGHMRKLVKIYLNLHDNLLKDEVYIKLKLLLVKNFSDFAATLQRASSNMTMNMTMTSPPSTYLKPKNYAIGANEGKSLPREDSLVNIINNIAQSSDLVNEQNGTFIAPITRGILKGLSVLCLYFGYPNPSAYHYHLIQRLQELYDDVHFILMQNMIEPAAATTSRAYPTTTTPNSKSHKLTAPPSDFSLPQKYKFKLPFRIPTDMTKPPISLSISVENLVRTSGTVGGYIYPMIDLEKRPEMLSYSNSKFAILCGHVCLNSTGSNTEYPHVSSPLLVLIHLYQQAVTRQYNKVVESELSSSLLTSSSSSAGKTNMTSMGESKAAYKSVLSQLDEIFPPKDLKMPNGDTESHNLPIHRFGQIIWGERTLVTTREDEKRLSDLAVIKVNKHLECNQNYLGDDVSFNEFDPALIFDNLYVRAVIGLNRNFNEPQMEIQDVDEVAQSVESIDRKQNNHGLPVFKYGSTTKYTRGLLNGIKLVYWLDGAIQSSEFVVNSLENNSAFASGGDSGAWILAKLDDCQTLSLSKGLGVVGMLHLYDGEYKQFGLYTPMCEILERLEEVTLIKWGVVGVPEKDNGNDVDDLESDYARSVNDSVSSSDSEIGSMDGAVPPEVD